MTNGLACLPLVIGLEDFGSVLEHVIESAKVNLVYEYELEMNRLEDILNTNDTFLDELEENLTDLKMG